MTSVRFPRCAQATSLPDAYHGIADDLVADGFELPSVYMLAGHRLRCEAARGYFQVVDGFRPGKGVIGKVVASGVSDFVPDVSVRPDFIAASQGITAEACSPISCDGTVVGALSVESPTSLPADSVPRLEAAAAFLGEKIGNLGGMPGPSLWQRLAHVTVELTSAGTAAAIERSAVAAAAELSGMHTAALARCRPDGTCKITTTCGPLADGLRSWTADELAVIGSWVDVDTSSHYPGGDVTPPGLDFLLRAGVRATSVHPLVVGGSVSGYLIVASDHPVGHLTEIIDCLELLAAQTAAALTAAGVLTELTLRAARDELTGLGNRSILDDAIARAVTASAAAGHSIAALVVDLDDFKPVNDSFGHQVGDRVLVQVAEQIQASLRKGDIACRLGGDEFAIVLPHTSAAAACAVADRILTALGDMPAIEDGCLKPTASIGIVVSAEPHETPAALLKAADAAMYQAKERGKGRWVLLDQ